MRSVNNFLVVRPARVAALVVLAATLFAGQRLGARASTLVVDSAGGPGVFTTIQAAMNAAQSGDTIQVHAGTYAEVLDAGGKSLTITGAGRNVTVIDSGVLWNGVGTRAIQLGNNSTFTGFDLKATVAGDDHYGVFLPGSNTRIVDNRFEYTGLNGNSPSQGFAQLGVSDNDIVEGNEFSMPAGSWWYYNYGISSYGASGVKIRKNKLGPGAQHLIYTQGFFWDGVIEENEFSSVYNAIYIAGAGYNYGEFPPAPPAGKAKPLINANFIHTDPAAGPTGIAINTQNFYNWDITNNVIDGPHYMGMYLQDVPYYWPRGAAYASGVTVSGNVITHTGFQGQGAAIYILSQGVTVTDNRLACNVGSGGINVWISGGGHAIHRNSFVNNSNQQAWDGTYSEGGYPPNGPSAWDGNYWSDFQGRYPGATNNGTVWDTAYTLGGNPQVSPSNSTGSADHAPLVQAPPIGSDCSVPPPPHAGPPPDSTPPVIAATVSGTLGSNGWYRSAVDVSWTVTDADSAISSSTGCGPVTVINDTAGVTLTCSATSGGGTASSSVTIKRDATLPTIAVPANITTVATSAAGAVVSYSAPASDATSGIASATCAPASGSTFAAGMTTVTCTASDNAGNSKTATFQVTVKGAAQLLADLLALVNSVNAPGNSMTAKVQNAQSAFSAGNNAQCATNLKSLLSEVSAQSGKKLTVAQANAITALTNQILALL